MARVLSLPRESRLWQHAPVSKRPPAGTGKPKSPTTHAPDPNDPPPVAVPNAPTPLERVAPWVALVGGILAVVAGLTAPYLLYEARIAGVERKLALIDDKLNTITNWLKDPKTFPGAKKLTLPDDDSGDITPTPSPSASSAPAPIPGPSAQAPAPSADPPPSRPGPRGFPSSVQPTSPPECVSSRTFNRMPCEQAAGKTCRGVNGFAPGRYREIRLKAVTDQPDP